MIMASCCGVQQLIPSERFGLTFVPLGESLIALLLGGSDFGDDLAGRCYGIGRF